jgi:hypothetical protein
MLQSRTLFQDLLGNWYTSRYYDVCILYPLDCCPCIGGCGGILGIRVLERGREGGRGGVYAVEPDNIDYLRGMH